MPEIIAPKDKLMNWIRTSSLRLVSVSAPMGAEASVVTYTLPVMCDLCVRVHAALFSEGSPLTDKLYLRRIWRSWESPSPLLSSRNDGFGKPLPNDYNWLIGELLTSSASSNNPNMALKWLWASFMSACLRTLWLPDVKMAVVVRGGNLSEPNKEMF